MKINKMKFSASDTSTVYVPKPSTQKCKRLLFAIVWIAMLPCIAFSQNSLTFTEAPQTVMPGNVETVTVDYITTADSTIKPLQVRLINSLDSIIIEETKLVNGASGSETFSILIPGDLADETYTWNTQMFNDNSWSIVLATTEMEGITLNMPSEEDCNNICIGLDENYYPNDYNKLYIECNDPDNPLIEGDFENDYLKINGKLGISSGAGTTIIENIQHTHSEGDENFLQFNPKERTGKPIAISENGRITIGTDDICWRHITANDTTSITANDTTYLIVDGGAFKYNDAFWETISDERLKKDIAPLERSLNKFLNINFYSYKYKKTNKTRFGIMAQEMEKIFPHSMGTFTEGDDNEYQTFNPNNLMYTGLKATQEIGELALAQDAKIEQLEKENANLRTELETIKMALINNGISVAGNTENSVEKATPHLQQNTPNPFLESTTISYFLPVNTQEASIQIYDINGNRLKRFSLPLTAGYGNLELDFEIKLAKGIYYFSLIVDRELIDIKKMIKTAN